MMLKFMAAIALITLTACSTSVGTQIRGQVADRSAEEADAWWDSTKWAMCQAQSTGAVDRKITTQAQMDAYRDFCGRSGPRPTVTVTEPVSNE